MLFVNKERVDLKVVENYQGTDEAILLLKKTYHDMVKLGFPVKFKSNKMSKGNRPGKSAIWIPFSETIKTQKMGSRTITYCEQATGEGHDIKYEPRGMNYTKNLFLDSDDIELIVYLAATWTYLKNGVVTIDNPKAEHDAIARIREEGSTLNFYLYNKQSPVYDNRELLNKMASALGVPNAQGMTIEMVRNHIYDRVEASQKANDLTYGYSWFNDAIKGDSESVEILALIQEAINKKAISYNEKTYRWNILDMDGKETQQLCMVEPARAAAKKEFLARYLQSNDNMFELLSLTVQGVIEATGKKPKAPLPELTDAVDFKTLKFGEKRRLAKTYGMENVMAQNDEKLLAFLEAHRQAIVDNPL